ncbi:MAG: phosphate signaling complex protein PhoU [Acidobacteria bacterium]|nr:phosphate signaling complex protein PhoU [Acidobacteriota bacterium]
MLRLQRDVDLAVLRRTVSWMGDLVLERLALAVRSLVDRDADSARFVIDRDRDIDELQIQVDERALLLLALQNPEAGDLRFVVATIKANGDLERLGDQAVNIAEAALRLINKPALPQMIQVGTMAQRALAMVRDGLTAFLDRDAAIAREVLRQDDEVDAMKSRVLRIVLDHMTWDPGTIERGMELVIVSRSLERIADHATNMAEDAIFLVEALDVRHRRGDAGEPGTGAAGQES